MTNSILSDIVINWYKKKGRKLPWRPVRGNSPNPYHVLLSEFMLQQTGVTTVIPYFNKFVLKYPNIFELSEANLENILLDWSGLGYYRRAKNLHETSKIICKDFNGNIPQDYDVLIKMPGVGDYTASAILAIGFNSYANVVDGNIERIICRLNKITKRLDLAKKEIKFISSNISPSKNYAFYVQGLMDIGATICRPKNTHCFKCPLKLFCKVAFKKTSINLPKKKLKLKKKLRFGTFICYIKDKNKILLIKNEDKGLYSNMYVLPSFSWGSKDFSKNDIVIKKMIKKKLISENVFHSFTHFNLQAKIVIEEINDIKLICDHKLIEFADLKNEAIPTLFKKIINVAIDNLKI